MIQDVTKPRDIAGNIMTPELESGFPIDATIAEMTEILFKERLKYFKNNMIKTAESLGITVKTAYNWLDRYGMKGPKQ